MWQGIWVLWLLAIGIQAYCLLDDESLPTAFIIFLIAIGIAAVLVHIGGIFNKSQPWLEKVEIPFLMAWTCWGVYVLSI